MDGRIGGSIESLLGIEIASESVIERIGLNAAGSNPNVLLDRTMMLPKTWAFLPS